MIYNTAGWSPRCESLEAALSPAAVAGFLLSLCRSSCAAVSRLSIQTHHVIDKPANRVPKYGYMCDEGIAVDIKAVALAVVVAIAVAKEGAISHVTA